MVTQKRLQSEHRESISLAGYWKYKNNLIFFRHDFKFIFHKVYSKLVKFKLKLLVSHLEKVNQSFFPNKVLIYSINFIFLLGLKSCNRSCLTGEQSFHRTRNHEISTFTVVPSIFLISNLPKKYIQSVDNLPFIRFSRIFGSVTENNHANSNENIDSFASNCLYYIMSLWWTRTHSKFWNVKNCLTTFMSKKVIIF